MVKFEFSVYKNESGMLDTGQISFLKSFTKSECFIETGTYLGDTTSAMRSIFDSVVSIELSEELFDKACKRFKNDAGVILLRGDSASMISRALAVAGKKRSIIWLDAHWSGGNTAKSVENTPILGELDSIIKSGVSDLVILVDDISYFWNVPDGFNSHDSIGGYPAIEVLISYLLKINPEFDIFVNADLLFAVPRGLLQEVVFSDVLKATSRLRIGDFVEAERAHLERAIAAASGDEKIELLSLPSKFNHQLSYGVGGHFCYWRALVLEYEERFPEAKVEFEMARKCGVDIPLRYWE